MMDDRPRGVIMKLARAALCPALLAGSVKLGAKLQDIASNPCPDGLQNRYPSGLPQTITLLSENDNALNKGDNIVDVDILTAAMQQDADWKVGKEWIFQARFSSDSRAQHIFGFPGDPDFLVITVPAGVQNKVLQAKNNVVVKTTPSVDGHVSLQYRGPAQWTGGKMVITDICLTPKSCDVWEGTCPPGMEKKPSGTMDNSDQRCCQWKMCSSVSDEVCLETTKYKKVDNFSSKRGYNNATCCHKIFCPEDMCANDTKWEDTTGRLGSTRDECCEPRECLLHTCTPGIDLRKLPTTNEDGSARLGSTDEECCASMYCKDFTECGPNESWRLKADAETRIGANQTVCCEMYALCADLVTCPNNTQWKPNPEKKVGKTFEECCDKLECKDWTCSSEDLEKKIIGSEGRQGQSDDECCEKKKCSAWKCSDATKWVPVGVRETKTNLDRTGWSDEECCDRKYCSKDTCTPSTAWREKPGIASIQGSTIEQCCDKLFCGDYVCDTDDDGDGNGTQWYRRVDTNSYRWQGSTNEECCEPLYCSQFTTAKATKWRRKKDARLQGSTEAECYDPLWCSEYCCPEGKERRLNAEKHQGSTDLECCVDKSSK